MVEWVILLAAWITAFLLIILFTPRQQIREATVIFLFKQLLTWLFGLLVVEFLLIEYPFRIFQTATTTSFSFEFFIYPAVCVVFVLRYPDHKPKLNKIGWYLLFPTWITILEILIEQYTDLVNYLNWTWYLTWVTLLITFFMSHRFYLWFIEKTVPAEQS